jgi:formate dehydrogenase subunit gamma
MADITNKPDSVDAELQEVARELEDKLGADAVSQAQADVREQLKRELRDRLEVAARKRAPKPPVAAKPFEEDEQIERFSITFRVQHIVLFASCIILIISGIPLKFPNTAWAAWFFHLVGGVTASGTMHRVGAVGLISVGIFHMLYITATREGRYNFRELLPSLKDVKDVFRNVTYFLGFKKSGARFRRFSYIEKFDYWAVYWGMVVMITSGLMLWFQDSAMAIFPKFFIDMAHEAHSDEALLATLAIIIWHFYNVHFNPDNFPMSWTWLTGKISKTKMIHHHPEEYEALIAAKQKLAGGNGKKRKSSKEHQ